MTDYTLNPIPDSGGLYALPEAELGRIASMCLAARGGDPDRAKTPSNQVERVQLWRLMNETMAEAVAVADGGNTDLARLEAALGLPTTKNTQPDNFEIERRRLAARSRARAQCAALLEAGYTP